MSREGMKSSWSVKYKKTIQHLPIQKVLVKRIIVRGKKEVININLNNKSEKFVFLTFFLSLFKIISMSNKNDILAIG
jgi:hypothetical protein